MKKINELLEFEFSKISKYRACLMGIATLFVMMCHSWPIHFDWLIKSTRLKKAYMYFVHSGTFGVEMFLILSAIGLYYSYTKNKPKILNFYKKRFLRILPATTIVSIVTTGLLYRKGLKYFLSRVLMISLYTVGDLDFWFFSLIIILYLIFPFLYRIRERFGNKSMLLLIILDIVFNIFISNKFPFVYTRIEILLVRIPFFLLGIILADLAYKNKKINILFVIPMICAIPIIYLIYCKGMIVIDSTLYMYLNGLLGIAVLFAIVIFMSVVKIEFINKILIWIGGYSLEIYLLYEFLLHHCEKIFVFNDMYRISYFMCVIVLTIILQIGLKKVCNEIVNIFEKKE